MALQRQFLVQDRCELQDLLVPLEKLERLVRRHERSRARGTTTATLDEDIKTAALEALVPSDLEPHLAMHLASLVHVRAGLRSNSGLHRSPPKSVRTRDGCCTEHRRSTGRGQFRQWQQERQEQRCDGNGGEKGSKGQRQSQNPVPTVESQRGALFVGTLERKVT